MSSITVLRHEGEEELATSEVHRIAGEIFDKLTREHNVDDWRHEAACHGSAIDFFPVGFSDESLASRSEALSLCARCAVNEQCLVYAVASNIDEGIYGGLDEEERRRVRRRIRYMRNPG